MTDQTNAPEAPSSDSTSPTPRDAPRVMRADIQGIRALAVASVVLYHLWPAKIPGGFIGVDVFFAVSGFLITSHILSDVEKRSAGSFLYNFWARRVRRLMPAGLTVLATVLVVTVLFLPRTEWPLIGKHVAITSVFGENWLLAHEAVDYLGSENTPSPVQHYWSLSVEEQFYVVWPLLMLAALWLARRPGRTRSTAAAVVGVVTVASFVFALYATQINPDAAYFITPTRIWQLSAGALMAFVVMRSRILGFVLPWIGFALVLAGCFLIDGATPYPGWAALVPTIGTCFMLVGLQGTLFSFDRVVSPRPVQWLGDVSYSVYLWHWPIIVLFPLVTGIRLDDPVKLGILAATLVISQASFRWIETPARTHRAFARKPLRTYVVGVLAVGVILAPATIVNTTATAAIRDAQTSLDERAEDGAACFGAAALDEGCDDPYRDVDALNLTAAEEDRPGPWPDDCANGLGSADKKLCEYGDTKAERTVLLWGDSHSGAWSSAFDNAGKRAGFHVIVAMRQGCPSTLTAPAATVGRTITNKEQKACEARNRWVAERVVPKADVVVLANMTSNYRFDTTDPAKGYEQTVDAVRDADKPVFMMQDIALTGDNDGNRHNGPKCLEREGQCTNPVDRALDTRDVSDRLKKDGSEVKVIPSSDRFCDDEQCYAAIGGVSVYFDSSHLSAAYSASLGPWLVRTLKARDII